LAQNAFRSEAQDALNTCKQCLGVLLRFRGWNGELEGDILSHSAEFLGKEIKRRADKINAIAAYLHGRDLQKEDGVS
jgi:hypothetical protein